MSLSSDINNLEACYFTATSLRDEQGNLVALENYQMRTDYFNLIAAMEDRTELEEKVYVMEKLDNFVVSPS